VKSDQVGAYDQYWAVHKVHGEHAMYNLAKVAEFCRELARLSSEASREGRCILYRASHELPKKVKHDYETNSIVLLAVYLSLSRGLSPAVLKERFKGVSLLAFGKEAHAQEGAKDESLLTWLDYVEAMICAQKKHWFCPQSFDAESYTHFSNYANGDVNWIVHSEVLAFSSPCDDPKSEQT
jgi:hypothetical protein